MEIKRLSIRVKKRENYAIVFACCFCIFFGCVYYLIVTPPQGTHYYNVRFSLLVVLIAVLLNKKAPMGSGTDAETT
jgi:hypothetical protein